MNDREYGARLERLGCIICRALAERAGLDYDPPPSGSQLTVLHHPRDGVGGQQRSSEWLRVPLCVEDHTGPLGVHGNRHRMRMLKLTNEMDLVGMTVELYNQTYF